MSSIERDKMVKCLMEEKPKIDRAMKNYMSILMVERDRKITKSTDVFVLQSAQTIMLRIKRINLVSLIEYGNCAHREKIKLRSREWMRF